MEGIGKLKLLSFLDTPILPIYQLYHNYFREHEGLERKTPTEAAGIKIDGANIWIPVIQNAAHQKKIE